EHEALCAEGGALDLHAGTAGDKELDLERILEVIRQMDGAISDIGSLSGPLQAAGRGSAYEENGKQFFACAKVRHLEARGAGGFDALDAGPPGGFADGHRGPAVGPAAAERQVKSEAELAGLLRGEGQGMDEVVREVR